MLRHLAADERAPRLSTALDHARHQVLDLVGLEAPDCDVVKEEQGLGAVGGDVVDAHGHQVDADGGEPAGGLGDESLGADAVGGRHQDGIAITLGVEGEQSPEAADVADYLWTEGGSDPLLDAGDGLLSGGDADACRLVRLTHGSERSAPRPARLPPAAASPRRWARRSGS